jgi:hypothetical protein
MLVVTRGPLVPMGPFGNLDDDFRADRIDVRNVLGGDLLLLFLRFALALDFLEAGVERGGDGVPEVEEGVLVEADVDEHRLEAGLDVLDAALEDAADDVLVALALDGVFLEDAVLEQGDAAFEFLDVDDDAVAANRIGLADAEESFDVLDHG